MTQKQREVELASESELTTRPPCTPHTRRLQSAGNV